MLRTAAPIADRDAAHKCFPAWFNICICGPVLRHPTAEQQLLVRNIYTISFYPQRWPTRPSSPSGSSCESSRTSPLAHFQATAAQEAGFPSASHHRLRGVLTSQGAPPHRSGRSRSRGAPPAPPPPPPRPGVLSPLGGGGSARRRAGAARRVASAGDEPARILKETQSS